MLLCNTRKVTTSPSTFAQSSVHKLPFSEGSWVTNAHSLVAHISWCGCWAFYCPPVPAAVRPRHYPVHHGGMGPCVPHPGLLSVSYSAGHLRHLLVWVIVGSAHRLWCTWSALEGAPARCRLLLRHCPSAPKEGVGFFHLLAYSSSYFGNHGIDASWKIFGQGGPKQNRRHFASCSVDWDCA